MDPSMLVAFLIRDERDWNAWRQAVSEASGAAIIHVWDQEPQVGNQGVERREAIDEVEAFDDEYT
jgi:cysteine protease ATG4